MKILPSALLCLLLVSCTSNLTSLNTSNDNDLEYTYSFKTQALTESYLKKKIEKWATDNNQKKMEREIEYAKYKHPNILKNIMWANHNLYVSADNMTAVSVKRTNDSSFNSYMIELSGIPSSSSTATSPTNITSTSFIANWGAVTGATGYKLYVNGVETVLGNVTSCNLTGLTANTGYSYYVKATNSNGVGASSNTVSLTTSLSPSTATSPTNVGITGFTANWAAVTGATGYKLYINGVETILGNVTTYIVTGLTENTSYSYYVKPTNSNGDGASSNTVNVSTNLSAPTANSATNIGSTGFTANWNPVTSATGYKLYVNGVETVLGNVTTYNVTGLTGNTSYSYYVKAISSNGDSVSSNTENVSTSISAPTALNVTNMTNTSFNANWTAITGATGYKLYLLEGATIKYTITTGSGVTTYNFSSLDPHTSYSYYVKASNASGDGDSSNVIDVSNIKMGLSLYYPFNGNATDYSGYAINGTVTNAALTTDRNGNTNKAYLFSGNAYVDSTFNFQNAATDFSFSYWVKFYDLTGIQKMFHMQQGSDGNIQFEINNDNINNFNFYLYLTETHFTTPVLATNTWYHIVTSYNQTTKLKKIYLNGVLLVSSVPSTNTTTLTSSPLRIGARSSGKEFLKGSLDDFRVYKKELSQAEVSSLYSFTD